jgi:hypothetical protein
MQMGAFGKVLSNVGRGKGQAARAASAVLGRIGQYVFWLLIIVIVSARIVYYPASPALEVESATDPKHAVTR